MAHSGHSSRSSTNLDWCTQAEPGRVKEVRTPGEDVVATHGAIGESFCEVETVEASRLAGHISRASIGIVLAECASGGSGWEEAGEGGDGTREGTRQDSGATRSRYRAC